MEIKEITDEMALQEFLLDIDCLNALNEWTNKFNVFEVLKISRAEIRHSNMLSWLLSPRENHGLNDWVIRGLVEHIVSSQNLVSLDVFKVLLMDFYDFNVVREWNSIDLLLISNKSNLVICIENKVGSKEHSNQLNRYRDTVNKHYIDYDKIFLYLTPNKDDPSDTEHWLSLSYTELMDVVENAVRKSKLSTEIEFLIKNYIETVRWHIVGDERIIKICNEIYSKHKKALDLIFENKPDNIHEITDFILEYLKSLEIFNDKFTINFEKSSKSYIRFTSDALDSILKESDTEKSGWRTKNHYFYEVVNRGNTIKMHLALSKGDLTDSERENAFSDLIRVVLPNTNRTNWVWKTLKSWVLCKYTEEQSIDDIKEELVKKIDLSLSKIVEFESELLEKLNK